MTYFLNIRAVQRVNAIFSIDPPHHEILNMKTWCTVLALAPVRLNSEGIRTSFSTIYVLAYRAR